MQRRYLVEHHVLYPGDRRASLESGMGILAVSLRKKMHGVRNLSMRNFEEMMPGA